MAEFIEIIKKILSYKVKQTNDGYNKESYATQSKVKQKALIQSRVLERVINILGDTIEDMYKEKEQKGNEIQFFF